MHETKKINSEFPVGVDLQQAQQDILPPVPISTKLDSDDMKQQIMDLCPDLFSGVGTIKNAMVHLDVKPGAVPVVCSPCCVPHAIQPKLNSVLCHKIHNAKRFIDISSKIKGFKYISKIDANSGFWTLPLDPSSQLLTTFDASWGRFCFLKLPFGLYESQNFFQYYMDLNLENLTNAHIITDNVLIVGSDLGPMDDHDHDRCLL